MAAITTKIKHQWRRTESTQTEVQPSNFSQSFQRTPCLQDPRLYEMCTRDRLQEALENIASKKPAGKYREDAKSGLRARIRILAKVAFWELNKKNWKTGKGIWSKYICPIQHSFEAFEPVVWFVNCPNDTNSFTQVPLKMPIYIKYNQESSPCWVFSLPSAGVVGAAS